MKNSWIILVVAFLSACSGEVNSQTKKKKLKYENQIESAYWNDGKAEIATYELQQNRYDAIHPGNLVAVFVTEDFLTDKQVKNERYQSNESTKILKNIRVRKFTTGIYDYSLHTSVFTPLDRNQYNTLKVTNSVQEWCGTTFCQLNNRKNKYEFELRSYFETEGDQETVLNEAILEDELFNLLRINPSLLPQGEFEVIPSLNTLRLKHKEATLLMAKGKTTQYTDTLFKGKGLMQYTYSIESTKREVNIVFEKASPHQIVGFTEASPSIFDKKIRTTVAKLISIKKLPYWSLHNPEDVQLRKEIGL